MYGSDMEQLIVTHWKDARRTVESVAVKYGLPHHEWDDLVQDTLYQILKHPPKAVPSTRYLMGAVKKQAFQKLYEQQGLKVGHQGQNVLGRRRTAAAGLFQPLGSNDKLETGVMDERMLPPVASAEDVFMASLPSGRQLALRKAIDQLPDLQRTAMVLRYYEELSVPQVASEMGVTHGQASYYLEEGMKQIKRKLNPKGKG